MTTSESTSPSALSVDLFDTLVLRTTEQPGDVFLLVGRRALERGLLRPFVTAAQFQVLRKAAEQTARRTQRAHSGSSEVTLIEIYEHVPPSVLASTAGAFAALELEIERELIYLDPRTVERLLAARAAGCRTALLSDTYFGVDQVQSLLRSLGLPRELFDDILTSSQERVSKRDGGLFARLLQRWPDIAPGRILHIGDHRHADIAMARRAGLLAEWHDTGDQDVREHLRLEGLRHGHASPELASLRRLACGDSGDRPEDERWWFSLGASILGPLLAAFADWVVEECVRDHIGVVRPLMREGALFAPMIEAAARQRHAGLDVRPLFASRASTWLASLDQIVESDLHRMLQRQHVRVEEALSSLGLPLCDAPDALRAAAHVRLGAASRTFTPQGRSIEHELRRYLGREDVREVIARHAANARGLLQQYLEAQIGPAEDVALVDLGFRGTTGTALATAQPERRFHQFLVFGAEPVARLWRDGHDVRVFGAGPIEDVDLASPIARYPSVLEALLMAGGTTVGYTVSKGRAVPQLETVRTPESQQHATATCRAGVLAFQKHWLSWRRLRPRAANSVAAQRRQLVAPLHRLLTMPTADEAARLGELRHEDNDGGQSVRPIVDRDAIAAEMSPDLFLSAALESSTSFDRAWLWPMGACEARWPGALERRWRLAAGAADGAPAAIPALVLRARASGVRELMVWGAGEMGAALIKACRTAGVDVAGVTDSNPALWGSSVEGVPVLSPAEARDRGPHVYAIGSLAFADDIEQTLRREYQALAQPLQVFSPTTEIAA